MSALLGLIGKLFGRLMLFIYSTIGANNYALSLVIIVVFPIHHFWAELVDQVPKLMDSQINWSGSNFYTCFLSLESAIPG